VRAMDVSTHIVLWTFKKVKGMSGGILERSLPTQLIQRHMNIDYSVCQALRQIVGIDQALVVYDICCQWSLHFKQRVDAGTFLSLRDTLELIPSIGKFHLGAHVPECFALFSLNFVKGSAQLDGEILETLWSSLNKVASSTRSMSKAHRQEVLDDYMNDSNWKKMVRSGTFPSQLVWISLYAYIGQAQALVKKWEKALVGYAETKVALDELTARLDKKWIKRWQAAEAIAVQERGEHLRIYDVQFENGMHLFLPQSTIC
jgi:Kyakuja-Dileera-Zisupton transposase